jgi:hypothetical protein
MKWIPEPDEFFVGYFPEAPTETSSIIRKVIIGIGIAVVIIGFLLVYSQREFSASSFEYGEYKSVEGYLFKGPVPHIKVPVPDAEGKTEFNSILLVSFGKMGAGSTLNGFENQLGDLDGKFIRITGQKIHGHGKALLQIEENAMPEILNRPVDGIVSGIDETGGVSLQGEIVDPKCYFGVMKPGEGKPHMSCAIRCISGGIPPVFYSVDEEEYYLVLDENLQPANQRVTGMVGYEVSLTGRMGKLDDWKVIVVNTEQLKKQSRSVEILRTMMAMEEGMTKCGMN